jgi:hypothetical protein
MALTLNDIINQFSTATTSANDANQQRFQAALDALTATQTGNTEAYNQASSLLDQLGVTSMRNINESAIKAQGSGTQNTISSGLYNTTMLDSMLRDIAAKKEAATTELGQAISGQKAQLLASQASANTGIAGLISNLYGSAYDNAPDAALWAKLATESQSAPKATVTSRGSSSSSLSSMTDSMDRATPSAGVSTPKEAVMVTGTPSGKTWGNDTMTAPNTQSSGGGGVHWEGNALVSDGMSVPQPPSDTNEGSLNKLLGSDWLNSDTAKQPMEDLLKPADPSAMLPENRIDASSLYDYLKNNPNSGIPKIGESYMYKSIWRTMGQDPAIDMAAWSAFMK